MRVVRATAAALIAAGLTLPLAAGTSWAITPPSTADRPLVVKPGELPRGSAAKAPYLVDNIVHTAASRLVEMPWTPKGARVHSLRLLGHSPRGWVVKSFDGGNTWTLWSISDGKRHELAHSSVSEGEVAGFQLSGNHRRFIKHLWDGDQTTTITAFDLDSVEIDTRDFDGIGEVLSFSGAEAVVGTTETQRWSYSTQSLQPLGVDAAGADLRRGLLFVTDPASGQSGPTSLDAPGTPAWTAPMAQTVVSPEGDRILSRNARGGHRLTVRDLATGAVQASFGVRFMASEAPVWESNRSFVFIASVGGLGDEETLVRCRLSGECERVSQILPRDTISLPPR